MIRDCFFRPLLLAGCLATSCGSAAALSAKVNVSPVPAVLVGTVTIRDLAANLAAAPTVRSSVEMRRHLLPDGSPTSKQSTPAPGTLPMLPSNWHPFKRPADGQRFRAGAARSGAGGQQQCRRRNHQHRSALLQCEHRRSIDRPDFSREVIRHL